VVIGLSTAFSILLVQPDYRVTVCRQAACERVLAAHPQPGGLADVLTLFLLPGGVVVSPLLRSLLGEPL
jgi:hypothetical protein